MGLTSDVGLGLVVPLQSPLLIDNNSAVTVAKNPEHHGRMKHLDLRFHWLRDTVEAGHISPIHIPTTTQAADIFTKPLKHQKIDVCLGLLGLQKSILRGSVIITISHLLLLFISSFTDAPYASLFVIDYTYAYSTQSPNIALLSCLLQTLAV